MNEDTSTIGPLCKVGIVVSAQVVNGAPLLSKETSFIYGVGSLGITPFEKTLYDKKVGAQITIDVDAGQSHAFFGHLQCLFMELLTADKGCQLNITIQSVTSADTQEIVKAIAQGSECGAGCSCGCC